jgi:hypothetical protein
MSWDDVVAGPPTCASIPLTRPWIAITPATETAMPETARTAVPLSSCNRRTASSQATPPPPRRCTTASTSHGSSRARPTSSRATPVAAWNSIDPDPELAPRPSFSGQSSPIPATGRTSRHHRCRRTVGLSRTTPSGSTTTRRIADSVTRTATAGTPTTMSATSTGTGRMSDRKKLIGPVAYRLASNATPTARIAPASRPSTAPARVSPAAIRRVMPASDPTSRSAASRLSRASPPNRTALAMKTMTGVRRTTMPTAVSSTITAGTPSSGEVRPKASTRRPVFSVRVSVPR